VDAGAQLVAVEFGGSLKAEHATGRNMTPFVELEWGHDAYPLMWQIKGLPDLKSILNPEVVVSADPQPHLQNRPGPTWRHRLSRAGVTARSSQSGTPLCSA
jgi:D-lactate dehydrogenase